MPPQPPRTDARIIAEWNEFQRISEAIVPTRPARSLMGATMPTQQINSSTQSAQAPTMVPFTINNVRLHFWIHKDVERQLIQLMVKKASDTRPWNECERYAVFTLTAKGECYRNRGLPPDWGMRLTKETRIKEIQ